MVGAGLALTAAPEVKAAVSALCSVRTKSLGRYTTLVRENNIVDAVEAAVVRKKREAAKLNDKARMQAKKMETVDVALTTQ